MQQREPGALITSPRTDRIRKLVVQSGSKQLNQWLDYERDIRADFERAFGEAPGALVGIGIMTDSDNTRTTTRAWYGPLRLSAAGPAVRRLSRPSRSAQSLRETPFDPVCTLVHSQHVPYLERVHGHSLWPCHPGRSRYFKLKEVC